MFVRVKKIGAYEYLYLVENAREGGRHVQRVVKALGRRDEVEASGMLDALVASATRHSRRSIVLSSFYRGELAELRRVSIGPDLVFGRLWRETGYDEPAACFRLTLFQDAYELRGSPFGSCHPIRPARSIRPEPNHRF